MQYRHLQMARTSFVVVGKTLCQTKAYYDFWDGAKIKPQIRLRRSSRIQLLICPVTYLGPILWYSWLLFSFIFLLNFCQLYELGKFNIVSMFRLLETDTREQKHMKIEYRHLWINTGNDLCYEINFENRVKDKNNFFIKWNISFLNKNIFFILGEVFFFKIPNNLIASAFFFAEAYTKKHRYADCRGEFRTLRRQIV